MDVDTEKPETRAKRDSSLGSNASSITDDLLLLMARPSWYAASYR
jgi:hypothetical protein